jgi:hypothetical protein
MTKDTITLEVSQDFYDWWQKQTCKNNQGLMFIAWSAWKACEANLKGGNKLCQ